MARFFVCWSLEQGVESVGSEARAHSSLLVCPRLRLALSRRLGSWPFCSLATYHSRAFYWQPEGGALETNEQDENGSFCCFQWCSYLIVRSIAVNDETHARLMLWENSRNESHSEADKRVVPAPGTLGSLLCRVEEAGTLRLLGKEPLEGAINLRPSAKNDPWS